MMEEGGEGFFVCPVGHVLVNGLSSENSQRLASGVARYLEDHKVRLGRLIDKVRRIFLQEGDDHCWRDLYTAETAALVGVKDWVPKVLDRETMLKNCGQFVDCLLAGKHYVTPDEARQENAALRRENEELKARIAELEADLAIANQALARLMRPEPWVGEEGDGCQEDH